MCAHNRYANEYAKLIIYAVKNYCITLRYTRFNAVMPKQS